MIDGITVLSSKTTGNKTLLLVVSIFISLVILYYLCMIFCHIKDKDYANVIMLSIFVFIYIISNSVLVSSYITWNEEEHTEYKVMIDETVSFKDFYDNYELIDKDENIYTITKKVG